MGINARSTGTGRMTPSLCCSGLSLLHRLGALYTAVFVLVDTAPPTNLRNALVTLTLYGQWRIVNVLSLTPESAPTHFSSLNPQRFHHLYLTHPSSRTIPTSAKSNEQKYITQ
jgi:hypothetical protein